MSETPGAAEPSHSMLHMLRSIGWLSAAQLLAGGGQFLVGVLLARYLPLEDYGRWAFAFAFVALFSSFADFGISTLATRDLVRDDTRTGAYLGSALALKAGQALLLFCALVLALAAIKRDAATTTLILLLGAQVIVVSGAQLAFAVFRARGRLRLETLSRVCHIAPFLGSTAILIAMGADVQAFAWAALATAALGTVIAAMLALTVVRPIRLSLDRRLLMTLLAEVWPIGFATALTTVYYYADSVLLGVFRSEADVALYSAAYMPLLGIALIVGALRNAYFPWQSRAAVSDDGERRRVLRQYGRLTAIVALPVMVAGPIAAESLLALVYGDRFTPAAAALCLLFLTGGAMFFSSYFGSQLLASGRQRTYLTGVAAGAATNVALNLAFIPALGFDGAAMATLASESIVCVLMWYQTRRQGVALGDLVVPAIFAGVAMGGVLIGGLRVAPLYLIAAPAVVAYALTLFSLSGGAVRRQVIDVIRPAITRVAASPELPEAA